MIMQETFLSPQRTFILLLLYINVIFVGIASAEDKFINGFTDLPVMPGMRELPDANISFDTTSGRIFIAFAESTNSVQKVLSFYENVLPQLGWRSKTNRTFLREAEILTFDFIKDGDSVIVRFSIEPE